MKIALTIAGSDPSGGAGIQADLKTFHALGVYAVTVITAVTVQNSQKVFDVHAVPSTDIFEQIDQIFNDFPVNVVKIGMISNVQSVEAIVKALHLRQNVPVVLDPVFFSTSGYSLISNEARDEVIRSLFPLTQVITPNLHEASVLAKMPVENVVEMKEAATIIHAMGAKNVVVKGGHLKESATDVLFDGEQFFLLEQEKLPVRTPHGTGCTYASAIAANMLQGNDFFTTVSRSKVYLTGAIKNAKPLGKGRPLMDHFYLFS